MGAWRLTIFHKPRVTLATVSTSLLLLAFSLRGWGVRICVSRILSFLSKVKTMFPSCSTSSIAPAQRSPFSLRAHITEVKVLILGREWIDVVFSDFRVQCAHCPWKPQEHASAHLQENRVFPHTQRETGMLANTDTECELLVVNAILIAAFVGVNLLYWGDLAKKVFIYKQFLNLLKMTCEHTKHVWFTHTHCKKKWASLEESMGNCDDTSEWNKRKAKCFAGKLFLRESEADRTSWAPGRHSHCMAHFTLYPLDVNSEGNRHVRLFLPAKSTPKDKKGQTKSQLGCGFWGNSANPEYYLTNAWRKF